MELRTNKSMRNTRVEKENMGLKILVICSKTLVLYIIISGKRRYGASYTGVHPV
jgi:hypothetical protein